MKFNSQICTTRFQSETLLKLGLNKETADMTIHLKGDSGWYVTAEPFYEWEDDMNTLPSLEETEQILPAWSLHRLIEMMPQTIEYNSELLELSVAGGLVIQYATSNNEKAEIFFSDRLYLSVISCIEWLIKEGYFNEEYLVDAFRYAFEVMKAKKEE